MEGQLVIAMLGCAALVGFGLAQFVAGLQDLIELKRMKAEREAAHVRRARMEIEA